MTASAPPPARRRRDRRGRGLRGRLVPPVVTVGAVSAPVPLARTRAERFDDLVLDAVQHLEERWSEQLREVQFAVEPVPELAVLDDSGAGLDGDVVVDDTAGGPVPLGRLLTGRPGQPPTVIIYRRPLEARAGDALDLADLVRDVVVDQVARLLGVDPDLLDPPGH
jgi:predicted Zn-dependent protease with MMP-like domain